MRNSNTHIRKWISKVVKEGISGHESCLPSAAGLGLIVLVAVFSYLFKSRLTPSWSQLLIAIACFIAGFSGLIQILQREVSGPFGKPIRGNLAILSGLLIMIIFWSMGVLLLGNLLSK